MNRTPTATLLLLFLPAWAGAAPAFAPGADPDLERAMAAHDRMIRQFHTRPFGMSLTASWRDEAALQKIRDFLAQDASDDVAAVTGSHPYELVTYEGPQGLGLRGGGAVPGTAFRYMALRAEGAPAAVLDDARRDVVRAMEAVHVAHVITGVPGRIARGISRIRSGEPSGPSAIPVTVPELTPLFDGEGNPLPPVKNNGTNRADNSGGVLPADTWFWQDSCSKDQLVGWVVAMTTLYDAARGDPDIPADLVVRMEEDARLVGAMLREVHPMEALDGQTYGYDLVIMDADGRPSLHHGLNPLNIDQSVYAPPDSGVANVFHTVMALGIVKGLYHVSGDPEAEAFLYGDLVERRGFLDQLSDPGAIDYIYHGASTNFSDVNMVAIALLLNVLYEKDPAVLAPTRDFVRSRWWDVPGVPQSVVRAKQPYFNALYLAMSDRGPDPALAAETARLLKDFDLAPYLTPERVNCDEAELAAKECVALDGVTLLKVGGAGWSDGHPTATEALDPSIRPASNFDARSDPFRVNGEGSRELNPGGDLQAAYWLLRWLQSPGGGAVSANARDHRPVGAGLPDGLEDAPEARPEEPPEGGPPDDGDAAEGLVADDVPATGDDGGADGGGTDVPGDAAGDDGRPEVPGDAGGPAVGGSGSCSASAGSGAGPLPILAAVAALRAVRRRRALPGR